MFGNNRQQHTQHNFGRPCHSHHGERHQHHEHGQRDRCGSHDRCDEERGRHARHDDSRHMFAQGEGRGRGGHGRGHGRGHDARFGRGGMGGERRISSDDLQLIILALLEQTPRHGYDIIKELNTYTLGFYSPSPGMVYPILAFLEESDQATVSTQGNKKLYTITTDGITALEKNREHVNALLSRLEQAGQQMQKMQQAYAEEVESREKGDPLREAIHALKTALRNKRFASETEKQRLLLILQATLKEIVADK